jgi:hypothetical protein
MTAVPRLPIGKGGLGQRGGHVRMDADIRAMLSQAKRPQSPQELEDAKKDFPPVPSEGVWPC